MDLVGEELVAVVGRLYLPLYGVGFGLYLGSCRRGAGRCCGEAFSVIRNVIMLYTGTKSTWLNDFFSNPNFEQNTIYF